MTAVRLGESAAAGAEMPAEALVATGVDIVIGDLVIRAGTDAGEGLLTRAIRAARAAAS